MLRFIVFISFCLIVAHSEFEYGEFDLKVTGYTECKAPRKKYCGDVYTRVINDVTVKFDILVRENMTTIKSTFVGSLNNKEKMRLRIKDMCEHILFKPLLMANNGRCGFFKGHYEYSVDIQAVTRTIYGGKFLYGNWTYRSLYFNDYCNLHCGNLKLMIIPKKIFVSPL